MAGWDRRAENDPEASLFSGGAMTELYADQSSAIWGKEGTWLASLLFRSTSEDKRFSSTLMRQRMGI